MQTNKGFEIHTLANAPEGPREIASAMQKAFGGTLPNLVGVLAGSPEALQANAVLSQLVDHTSLSPLEQQILELAVSRENRCDYCLAAHTFLSRRLPQQPIQAARAGTRIEDPKLEALRQFAIEMVAKKGHVSQEGRAEFRKAGYTERQALEIIVVVALKTLHNLVKNLADTPVDALFTRD
jgi:uncharacterized peroxidase-related enzyme